MTVGEWLEWAKADALTRGLPNLVGLLEGLAQATERLRAADWNDDPSAQPGPDQASLRAGADRDTPTDGSEGRVFHPGRAK